MGDSLDEIYLQGKFSTDTKSASEIKQKILSLNSEHDFKKIVSGMEATSIYSFHPALFFQNDPELLALDIKTNVENPRTIKKYANSYDIDKTDTNDAFVIADFFRIGLGGHSVIREEEFMVLQQLTRAHYQIVLQLVQTKQHFLQTMCYKANTLSKELNATSASVFSATSIDLMTEELSLDDTLQRKGRGRFKDPEKLAKVIKKTIRDSYRLGAKMTESIDTILGIQAREIRALKRSIKEFDKVIENLVQTIPEYQYLTSIPGIGKVYTAGMLAEIGQIERFKDQANLAKYARLTWSKNQSRNYKSENTPLNHTGNRYLRYY